MKAIILGGNGLVGRELTKQWLEKDKEVKMYIVSRSGNNVIANDRVYNIKNNLENIYELKKVIPNDIDFIIDLIGGPQKNEVKLKEYNLKPAEVTINLTETMGIENIGFVGASLGPKNFLEIKKDITNKFKQTGKSVSVVAPTIIYGEERKDSLGKLIPIFKILGVFSEKLKPVHVSDVASSLLEQLLKNKEK